MSTAVGKKKGFRVPGWLTDAAALRLKDGSEIAVAVIEFTPDLAGQLLAHNDKNRKIRPSLAKRYAASMLEGMFVFNGQTLIFTDEGQILDGQHRLTACIQSGKSFTALVVWGISRTDAVMASMDTGSGRTRSDVLRIQYGAPDPHNVGTACGYLFGYYRLGGFESMFAGKRPNLSHWQICGIFEEFPQVVDTCRTAHALKKRVSPGVMGALRVVLAGYDAEAEKEFFDKLVTGASLDPGHPVLALRQALDEWAALRGEASRFRAKIRSSKENIYLFAIAIKAWNAFSTGQPLSRIKWNPEREVFPAIVQNREAVQRQIVLQKEITRQRQEEKILAHKKQTGRKLSRALGVDVAGEGGRYADVSYHGGQRTVVRVSR